MVKVVDIFAGPGGLGEGFSRVKDKSGNPCFHIVLSIEMEKYAADTLRLRSFLREFGYGNFPSEYYRMLQRMEPVDKLYERYPRQAELARNHCWKARLGVGGEPAEDVRERIDKALGKDNDFVLIGGPPCQAYSLAGRSRNKGKADYIPEEDERQRLYVEYLQILADHEPIVFIMENVKGLLSSTLNNRRLFSRILEDLEDPAVALNREEGRKVRGKPRYRIYSLAVPGELGITGAEAAVVHSEDYGVPQARHRVILLGVREGLGGNEPAVLNESDQRTVLDRIENLPKLRGGVSRGHDSYAEWSRSLRSLKSKRWLDSINGEVRHTILGALANLKDFKDERGGEFIRSGWRPFKDDCDRWFRDKRLNGFLNHTARAHMKSDLHRYLFAACFAQVHERSSSLSGFPVALLPNHKSAARAVREGSNFADRFRVQVWDRPGTTIMSHISKDGHYYIHPDPLQCRSLTVREAARLQTFPDNYFFCGPRTAQYIQVGNAVPPYLAYQIAQVVRGLLTSTGRSSNGQDQQKASQLEHVTDQGPGHEAGNGRAKIASSDGVSIPITSEGSSR